MRGDARYVEHIPIPGSGGPTVSVAQVDYILAAGWSAELYIGDRRFIVPEALHVLERRLDPHVFMRIHQSTIVRIDRISQFLPTESGDHEIRLSSGAVLWVSRSRRHALQERLAAAS